MEVRLVSVGLLLLLLVSITRFLSELGEEDLHLGLQLGFSQPHGLLPLGTCISAFPLLVVVLGTLADGILAATTLVSATLARLRGVAHHRSLLLDVLGRVISSVIALIVSSTIASTVALVSIVVVGVAAIALLLSHVVSDAIFDFLTGLSACLLVLEPSPAVLLVLEHVPDQLLDAVADFARVFVTRL